jgi:hypothetical protein
MQQENIAAPQDGAKVMMPPPQIDPVAMPPRREPQSRLEDAGDDEVPAPANTDAIDVELRDQTQMLAKVAGRICELAQQKQLPVLPVPSGNTAPPTSGNPFKQKGAFKYHYIIFNELLTGWKNLEQLNSVIEKAHKIVKETTLASYAKALGGLVGYKLHHDKPSNSYCLTQE